MKLNPLRFVAFIGLLFTLAVVLVTCPTNVNQAPAANPFMDRAMVATSTVSSGTTERQWLDGSGAEAENEWLNSVVDAFNTENQDYQRSLNLVPSYDKQIQASLAGETSSYLGNLRLPDSVTAGSLEPYEFPAVTPNAFDHSLPRTIGCSSEDFSALGLVHNEQIVTNSGLQVSSADWAWDDLRWAAKALTHKNIAASGLSLSSELDAQISFISQAGSTVAPAPTGRSAW